MKRIRFLLQNRTYTEFIIAINVTLYIATVALGFFVEPQIVLIIFGALVPQFVLNGEVWRFITHAFLHANSLSSTLSILHIVFNMYFLWQLGPFIERFFGKNKFLLVYLFAAFTGGLGEFIWSLVEIVAFREQTSIAIGASGAIFGLLGLLLGHALQTRRYGVRLPIDYNQLYLIIALNLFIGFLIPSVSNAGHIGGLLGGLIMSQFVDQAVTFEGKVWKRRFVKIALPVMVVLTLVAFVAQTVMVVLALAN